MCISFVFRKDNVLIGMNFDNDGKKFRLSTCRGNDFLVAVQVNGNFYPSFGVSSQGVFVNDLMVDPCERGKYKRQNERRWLTTGLLRKLMENSISFNDLPVLLGEKEIVHGPFLSTHNMIVDRNGSSIVVEPGRRNIFSSREDCSVMIMANFPLSDYPELLPETVSGCGCERYRIARKELCALNGTMDQGQGFAVLEKVKQDGPEWKTNLSLVYLPLENRLFMCFDRNFARLHEYNFQKGSI